MMKKIIVFVLCTIMALSTVACSSKVIEKEKDPSVSKENSVQIPNPFVDCETLEMAKQLAGFNISLPEKMPKDFTQNEIRAIENNMIEVNYKNGDDEIYIRKAKGNEDISGDYNEYNEKNTITIGNLNVTTKGNDNMIQVVIWNDGDYTYAIGTNNDGKGIDKNIVNDMIKNIK